MARTRRETRRTVFRWAGMAVTGGFVALGGCTVDVDPEPDPRVVREEVEPDLDETMGGDEITVSVLVHNVGDAGEVTVTVETRTAEEHVLDVESAVFDMDAESQEDLTITMTVSGSAEMLSASAEPAP